MYIYMYIYYYYLPVRIPNNSTHAKAGAPANMIGTCLRNESDDGSLTLKDKQRHTARRERRDGPETQSELWLIVISHHAITIDYNVASFDCATYIYMREDGF